jgi:hypothetical protein
MVEKAGILWRYQSISKSQTRKSAMFIKMQTFEQQSVVVMENDALLSRQVLKLTDTLSDE